jgi:hypothetical protein
MATNPTAITAISQTKTTPDFSGSGVVSGLEPSQISPCAIDNFRFWVSLIGLK